MPYDEKKLIHYVTKPTIGRNTIKVYILFQSSVPFNRIKFAPNIMPYLHNFQIWITPHQIRSNRVLRVAWLYGVNPNYTSKLHLANTIKTKLPTDFPDFQLHRMNVKYNKDEKLSTDAWCIEIDGDNNQINFNDLMKHLPMNSDLPIIPMNSSHDPQGKIQKLFMSHNAKLHDTTAIRVDNLCNLDIPLINTDQSSQPSIRDHFKTYLTANNKPLFLDVQQYNSKRVHFICTKANEENALHHVTAYIKDHLLHMDNDFLQQFLCDQDPRVVSDVLIGTQLHDFLESINLPALDTALNIPTDVSITHQPPNPRKRPSSYSSAVSQSDGLTVATNATTHPGSTEDISLSASQLAYETKINQAMETIRQRNDEIDKTQQNMNNRMGQLSSNMEEVKQHFADTLGQVTNIQNNLQQLQTNYENLQTTISALQQHQVNQHNEIRALLQNFHQRQTHSPSSQTTYQQSIDTQMSSADHNPPQQE